VIPRAIGIVVIVLGVSSALAQEANDATLAAVQSGAGGKDVAGTARQVTQSAINTVFGGTEPVAPAPAGGAAAPAAAVPGAPAAAAPVAPDGSAGAIPAAVAPDASAGAIPAAGAPGAPAVPGMPAAGQPAPSGAAPPPDPAVAAQVAAAALAERGRDPFRPFTLNLRPDTQDNEILTPLQRFELPQLKLTGVVLDLRPPRAMLQDNSGMGYIITPGTPIGRRRGVVKAIEPRRVVVEERILDYYGREQIHQVVIEMPKETTPQNPGQG